MLNDLTDGKLQAAKEFASQIGLSDQLESKLTHLERHCKNGFEVRLYPDFSPYSFEWSVINPDTGHCSLNGGLIFHGSHDGGGNGSAPTYSVSLNPTTGWSIHT